MGIQEIWEVPYDAASGNWTLPGTLVASFPTASDKLAARFSGVHPTFPKTAAGEYVVFDGSTGKIESYNQFPNQGFHLGVVPPHPNSTLRWQSSPWGTWDVAGTPIVLDGVNCTFHAITNADGRYGADDGPINYAGSYASVTGESIVYVVPRHLAFTLLSARTQGGGGIELWRHTPLVVMISFVL